MCLRWVKFCPGYNVTICTRLFDVIFEDFYVTGRQYIYKMMWDIDAHYNENYNCSGSISGGSRRTFPNTFTSTVLKFIANTNNLLRHGWKLRNIYI